MPITQSKALFFYCSSKALQGNLYRVLNLNHRLYLSETPNVIRHSEVFRFILDIYAMRRYALEQSWEKVLKSHLKIIESSTKTERNLKKKMMFQMLIL